VVIASSRKTAGDRGQQFHWTVPLLRSLLSALEMKVVEAG
jgi:hypothetical protein